MKPDKIQVQSEQSGPLKVGEKARFHCGASGHTSKPLISWWKSELREDRLAALNESVRAQLFTKIADNEVLEFQATPDDHGKVLKCKVNMPTLDAFELSEHVSIQVLCKWPICMCSSAVNGVRSTGPVEAESARRCHKTAADWSNSCTTSSF